MEDFKSALFADLIDNCFLQQNAFDEVDGNSPADRQVFMMDKLFEAIDAGFEFETKDQARKVVFDLTSLYRDWNYTAPDSEEYKNLLARIDAFIQSKGHAA